MKILLIQPAKSPRTIGGEDIYLYEPLALEYVAAGVAGDHEVRILDMRLEKNLAQALAAFQPDIVGITAYTVHVNTVKGLFAQVKGWNPRTLTVVGGHHATVVPDDFASPDIDLIVVGEGVAPFREIVRRRERKEGFDGISGVAFTRNGGLVRVAAAPELDLDAVPPPNRALTAAYRRRYRSDWMQPLASTRTSKGCPYRCKFCGLWRLTGGRYLKRQPQQVVEELGTIQEPFVFFADDESLVDAARMRSLAGMIKAAGIRKRYFLYGRADTVARNPQLLAEWREAGLERVFVGFEFFREEDLKYVGKGSTTVDNARAAQVLHDLDIEIHASLIVRPEFDREDFARLAEYCRKLNLNYAGFAVLTPLPGTELYDETKERLITRDYDLFDFIHTVLPPKLPLQEFYAQYARLYRTAVPASRQLSLLKRYRLAQFPEVFATMYRWTNRLKTAHLDHG
jgi:radical SAM superfamily enzyme YgiQ (UPF0313 family)